VLIDTHNDLPIKLAWTGKLDLYIQTLDPAIFATDIQRMREGRLSAQFWSGFVPCDDYQKWPGGPVLFTLNQIDLIKRMIKINSDLDLAKSSADIQRIFKSGKIASLIGIEGGHQINGSISVLRQYRELGVLYMTLTHACHTTWSDSCSLPTLHNGLTTFGKEIVQEMNRIGMMVDISHVSHKTMQDVIETTKAPLFASHSSVFSLCNTTRNIPDFVLDAMKTLDGVVMINFWNSLITCNKNATLSDVVAHIEYIRNRVGAQHVGIGADLDGINLEDAATGLGDVSRYPHLFAELIRRGFSDEEVIGIMGANFL
jgi:membrane dipeptidase